MARRRRLPLLGLLAAAGLGLLAGPAVAEHASSQSTPTSQTITVERPAGQVVLSDMSIDRAGRLELTVTDTRSDDPGWTVSVNVAAKNGKALGWRPYVVQETGAFTTSDGQAYGQRVLAGASVSPAASEALDMATLASAPAGHGLGIARVGAKITGVGHAATDGDGNIAVTVTVV